MNREREARPPCSCELGAVALPCCRRAAAAGVDRLSPLFNDGFSSRPQHHFPRLCSSCETNLLLSSCCTAIHCPESPPPPLGSPAKGSGAREKSRERHRERGSARSRTPSAAAGACGMAVALTQQQQGPLLVCTGDLLGSVVRVAPANSSESTSLARSLPPLGPTPPSPPFFRAPFPKKTKQKTGRLRSRPRHLRARRQHLREPRRVPRAPR